MRQFLVVLALLSGSASAQAWEPISHGPDGLFVGFLPRALAVGADGDVFLPATCIQCAGPFDGIAHWDAQTAAWSPIPIVHGMAVSGLQLVEAAGSLRLDADLGGLAPGVYLVRLAAEGRVEARRVTVLR